MSFETVFCLILEVPLPDTESKPCHPRPLAASLTSNTESMVRKELEIMGK